MTPQNVQWDRHAIVAEVYRRGTNLTKLALDNGLSPSVCRAALCRPLPSGEKAISDLLGIPVSVLWPDRHSGPATKRSKTSAQKPGRTSPNRNAA